MLIDPAVTTALAFSLAALFAASAAHKVIGFRQFASVVRNYRITPDAFAPLAAVILVAMEFAIAAALVAPAFRVAAGLGAAGLFVVYASAIGFNLARGRRDIDCGCGFGGSGERLTPVLIFRNLGLALFALAAAAPVGARSLELFDVASIALFALSAAALYVAFEGLRANAARFAAAGHIR